MKLAHIALWTRDIEEAAKFWRTYFDAQVGDKYVSRNRPGFVSRFVTLPGNDVPIELMQGPWVTSHPGEACGWAHVAYSVGSTERVDELAKRFEEQGLLLSGPRWTGDGLYEAVIKAPDGILIELTV